MFMLTRRRFLQNGLLLAATPEIVSSISSGDRKKFKIGACDWSLGMGSNIKAFDIAQKIGIDGLMVDMGSPQNDLHLRNSDVQKQFRQKAQSTKIRIASLAIGALNNYPYKSDPQTEQWVWDSIDVAKNLQVPVVLLAFFHKNDLRDDEQGIKEVIRRLKHVAPKAEQHGIILGIESYLNAADHLRIMDAVGSKAIKVYMDFRNTADAGYNPVDEFKKIGSENVCELHMKENGKRLGEGDLPWTSIRDAIRDLNYFGDGWMQIESSNPENTDVVDNYRHNLNFLQKLFNA
jgi:sugar phosphate isomerase/epimerase